MFPYNLDIGYCTLKCHCQFRSRRPNILEISNPIINIWVFRLFFVLFSVSLLGNKRFQFARGTSRAQLRVAILFVALSCHWNNCSFEKLAKSSHPKQVTMPKKTAGLPPHSATQIDGRLSRFTADTISEIVCLEQYPPVFSCRHLLLLSKSFKIINIFTN